MSEEIRYPFIYSVVRKTGRYITGFERPNYKDGWPYCNHCKRNMEKGTITCPKCNRAVRHQPISNKKGLKRY